MSFEQPVEEDYEALVVGTLEGVSHNIGENATLRQNLEISAIDLEIWNVGVGAVIPKMIEP